ERVRDATFRVWQANIAADDRDVDEASLLPTLPNIEWRKVGEGQVGRSLTFLMAVDGEAGSGGLVFVCGVEARGLLGIEVFGGDRQVTRHLAIVPSDQRLFTLDSVLPNPRAVR